MTQTSIYCLSKYIHFQCQGRIFEAWVCVSLQGASREGQTVRVLVEECLMWLTEQFQSRVMEGISGILSSDIVTQRVQSFHFIDSKSGGFTHPPNLFLLP